MELGKHIKEHEALGIDDGFFTGSLYDSTLTKIATVKYGRITSVEYQPQFHYLMEDGVSFYLMEDGTSKYLIE